MRVDPGPLALWLESSWATWGPSCLRAADPGLASKLAWGPGAHPQREPNTPNACLIRQQAGEEWGPLCHSSAWLGSWQGMAEVSGWTRCHPQATGRGRGLDPAPVCKWA